MIRFSGSRSVLILCVIFILAVVPVHAQSGNLLTNPGFEPPFATVAGSPPREVAQGWTPWHVPATADMSSSENVQPEYYPASDTTNGLGVPRVRSGTDAQQYFSFFATHVGGVYQTISGVTPGDMLRFSVYAYLWSSTFDDPDLSEEDGSLILQVGIDPTGGTDGESANVVWSIASQTYDTYAEYSVSAEAAASSVTVFVRSNVSFPVKNNVVYLDDAALTVETGGGETTATVEAPTATTEAATATTEPPTVEPPTATTEAPTATVEATSESTSEATAETTSEAATATSEPPTATTEPPTATTEPPTATSEPPTATTEPPTQTPSSTPIPPTATPVTPTEIPATATNTSTPAPSPTLNRTQFPLQIIYLVSEGDTVGAIAGRYATTVEAIIIANGLNANALIFAGQQLIIPVSVIPTATFTPSITPTGATAVPTSTTAAPTRTNTPPAPTFTGPTILYIVQAGDTLSGIAQRFGTTVTAIAQANNILNLQLVFVGQRLNIPSRGVSAPPPTRTPTRVALTSTATATQTPTTAPTVRPVTGGILYRVQPGDNLYGIAVRFGVTVNALVQLNKLSNPSRIYVGQLITIP